MTGYPTPGKAKARMLLEAFCAGAGGNVSRGTDRLMPGGAAFYGVVPATKHLWDEARDDGREWVYLDNAYTDPQREVYFRATVGGLQHPGLGASDGKRFAALNQPLKPWRKGGSHILLCPQSYSFMRDCAEYPGNWLADTLRALKGITDRPLRVRPWTGNKREWYRTLPADLVDCWALVTYSSASAITAIMAGIPAIVTAEDCIARPVAGVLSDIAAPPIVEDRLSWLGVVADNQWTVEEMRDGTAWRMLHR